MLGIDPGMTIGVACLDLNGRLVMSASRHGAGKEWVTEAIGDVGTPVLVASDRPDPGDVVRKICAAFNAVLYTPKNDISMAIKRDIARDLGIKNPHERDAYVAAITAYKHFSNKFRQVEHIARLRGISDAEHLKAMVVLRHSLDEAMNNRNSDRMYR